MSEPTIVILCILFCVFLAAVVGKEIREERLRSSRRGSLSAGSANDA